LVPVDFVANLLIAGSEKIIIFRVNPSQFDKTLSRKSFVKDNKGTWSRHDFSWVSF
jgi:hypothetical protein